MRLLACLLAALCLSGAEDKLTPEERVDLIRGLMAEYATAKVIVPRSKKPLTIDTQGKYDKADWTDKLKDQGPAARVGDMVQVTKVDIDSDRLVLDLNGGAKSGKKWYERVEVGMGNRTSPIGQGQTNAPGGTTIELVFPQRIPHVKAAEVKKMLAPVLDFEKRTATESYLESLPEPVQKAIKEGKAKEGMDRDQVLLALGKPVRKIRETKDGEETEDWVYGHAPGKITFVTFTGSKVSKVKETYAGLGEEAAPLPPPL